MSEIGRLNIEGAKANPEAYFASPLDLIEEIMLTRGEKLATLERWRANILRQIDAASEGMRTWGGGTKDADLLEAIEQARRQLATPQHA